jgi:nucleotide-binding universal stress UspA family protein
MYRNILVPTDGSPLSLKAAKAAIALAKALRARITVVYVIPPYPPPPEDDGMFLYAESFSQGDYAKRTQKHAQSILAKVDAAARTARVSCASLYVTGAQPWKSILRTARSSKCDLIAMASHGRRGLAALLLGSETTKVLTHSKIPVLVCR